MQRTVMTRLRFLSIAIISLLLGLTSCKKDKNDHPDNPGQGTGKLKEFSQDGEFIRFSYNADGTVQKARVKTDINTGGEEVDYFFAYNNAKQITGITTSNAGEKLVPVYENGRIQRVDYFDGPVRIIYTDYTYETGNLKKSTIYFNQGADFEPFMAFEFNWANGNISRSDVLMATDVPGQLAPAGHVLYQYDSKSNPLYDLKDFFAILWQAPSINNITKEEHFDQGNQLEDVLSYVYTYKANGAPEKAVVTQGIPGQTQTTSNVQYLYH